MTLFAPRVRFAKPDKEREASWKTSAAKKGLEALQPLLTESKEATSARLEIDWPKHLPGLLAVTLREDRLAYEAGDVESRRSEERGPSTRLVSFQLLRLPKGPVASLGAVREWEGKTVEYWGVHLDTRVRIRSEGKTEKDLFLSGVPILVGEDGDRDEGEQWEIVADSAFTALPTGSLVDEFREAAGEFWRADEDPGRFATMRLAPAVINVRRTIPRVDFLASSRIETKDVRVPIASRWVFEYRWGWRSAATGKGELEQSGWLIELAGDGGHTYYGCTIDPTFGPRTEAIVPLRTKGSPRKNKKWVSDIALSDPVEQDATFVRGQGRAFWLLPEGVDPKQDGFRTTVKEAAEHVPGERLKQYESLVIFKLGDPWTRYKALLEELLRHLLLADAWKQKHAERYEADRRELDLFTNVVEPIYRALWQVKFEADGGGMFAQATFGEMSTGSRLIEGPRLRERVAAGRYDLLGTLLAQDDLAGLHRMAQAHAMKAFEVFNRPELQRFFLAKPDPFLEAGAELGVKVTGAYERGRGFAGRLLGRESLRTPPEPKPRYWVVKVDEPFTYSAALKVTILNRLAMCLPLRADAPRVDPAVLRDSGAADVAHELHGSSSARRAAEAQEKRRKEFTRTLGAMYVDIWTAHTAGRASGVTGLVGADLFWDSLATGGPYVALYGSEELRKEMFGALGEKGLVSKTDLFLLTAPEMDVFMEALEDGYARDIGESNEAFQVGISLFQLIFAWYEVLSDDRDLDAAGALRWGEVVLSTLETGLKMAELIKPTWFKAPVGGLTRLGGPGVKAATTELTTLGKVAGRLGRAAGKLTAVIGVAVSVLDLMELYYTSERGFDVDPNVVAIKLLQVGAAVVMVINPAVGAALGVALATVDYLYGLVVETDLEALMQGWWLKTPWGYFPGAGRDEAYDGDMLPKHNPREVFVLCVEKLNRFLNLIHGSLDEDRRERLYAFLEGYCRTNARRYGLTFRRDREALVVS